MDNENDYEVGYGKPPKETRFKKGQSGNPKGRPKGSKNLKTDLEEVLASRIPARSDGREIMISKQRALLERLAADGINGNAQSAHKILDLQMKLNASEEPGSGGSEPLSEAETALLDEYVKRRQRTTAGGGE